MLPAIPREYTQAASFSLVLSGLFLMLLVQNILWGVALIGLSCWILMISESLLHAKIQIEMHRALDDISRKKEQEVEEVLYFLRQSSIAASPFESIDGAKKLCKRMQSPAMVLSTSYQIIEANEEMHRVLGWKDNSLSSIPAYTINDVKVMSRIGEYGSLPENIGKNSMTTHYVYVHKSGKKIFGIMNATKIGKTLEGFFVTFYPEEECVIGHREIRNL